MKQEVRITSINKNDAYYKQRKELIGQLGSIVSLHISSKAGYVGVTFVPNSPVLGDRRALVFYAVKLEAA
jgi:hypothetical protein